jgi:SAM-dependent methyltransferase
MELAELESHWNVHGEVDPLWAILSQGDKRGNGWDVTDFFAAGVRQVDELFQRLDRLRIDHPSGPALDFGCGVGRLTQALLRHVDRCHGVDIAASMIQRAEAFNRHGDRARYVVNTRDDLNLFATDTFGLVYSSIVLQHMEPRYALGYIREFIRVLRPGGLAVFQLPGGLRPVEEIAARFPDDVAYASLPDEGFRAWIAVDPPPPLTAGRRFTLPVRVRNTSPVRWPHFGQPDTKYAIRLGNRWHDEQGQGVEQFDERLFFDRSLAPGDESRVNLAINAPRKPGRYLLEIDVAQEWVGWFRDRGNRSVVVGVDVGVPTDDGDGPGEQPAFDPRIEMYAVPSEEVVATVAAAGGRLLHVEECGTIPTDLDYEYFITKP